MAKVITRAIKRDKIWLKTLRRLVSVPYSINKLAESITSDIINGICGFIEILVMNVRWPPLYRVLDRWYAQVLPFVHSRYFTHINT